MEKSLREKITDWIKSNALLLFLCAVVPSLIFMWIAAFATAYTMEYIPPFKNVMNWATKEYVYASLRHDYRAMEEATGDGPMWKAIVGFIFWVITWMAYSFLFIFLWRYLTSFI